VSPAAQENSELRKNWSQEEIKIFHLEQFSRKEFLTGLRECLKNAQLKIKDT